MFLGYPEGGSSGAQKHDMDRRAVIGTHHGKGQEGRSNPRYWWQTEHFVPCSKVMGSPLELIETPQDLQFPVVEPRVQPLANLCVLHLTARAEQ